MHSGTPRRQFVWVGGETGCNKTLPAAQHQVCSISCRANRGEDVGGASLANSALSNTQYEVLLCHLVLHHITFDIKGRVGLSCSTFTISAFNTKTKSKHEGEKKSIFKTSSCGGKRKKKAFRKSVRALIFHLLSNLLFCSKSLLLSAR